MLVLSPAGLERYFSEVAELLRGRPGHVGRGAGDRRTQYGYRNFSTDFVTGGSERVREGYGFRRSRLVCLVS